MKFSWLSVDEPTSAGGTVSVGVQDKNVPAESLITIVPFTQLQGDLEIKQDTTIDHMYKRFISFFSYFSNVFS